MFGNMFKSGGFQNSNMARSGVGGGNRKDQSMGQGAGAGSINYGLSGGGNIPLYPPSGETRAQGEAAAQNQGAVMSGQLTGMLESLGNTIATNPYLVLGAVVFGVAWVTGR